MLVLLVFWRIAASGVLIIHYCLSELSKSLMLLRVSTLHILHFPLGSQFDLCQAKQSDTVFDSCGRSFICFESF